MSISLEWESIHLPSPQSPRLSSYGYTPYWRLSSLKLETVSQNHKCPNLKCVPQPSNPSRSQTWENNQPESNLKGWLFKANISTGTKSWWEELVVVSGLYSVPADLSGLPRWLSGWRTCLQRRRHRRCGFDPWVGKIPWRRAWQPTPVFLPGESRGWAWWTVIHSVTKSWTQRKWLSTHTHTQSWVEVFPKLTCARWLGKLPHTEEQGVIRRTCLWMEWL